MRIVCQKCLRKFNIQDEKLPTDRATKLTCPSCKSKITVEPRKSITDAIQDGFSAADYDASEKPFDFIEEEGNTALICESDPGLLKKVMSALNLLEYHVTISESGRDALKKMRYHQYDLILVNEAFHCDGPESNMVMLYLERMNMNTRRNMFVVMLSGQHRTMDQMMAFRYSVNIIVNIKNIDDIGKVIQRGLTDNKFFYRVFNETLKEVGRA